MTTDTITVLLAELKTLVKRMRSESEYEFADELESILSRATPRQVKEAIPNNDSGCDTAHKHHIFIYEVDFGDEGKGRYVRLNDFNKVCAALESLPHNAAKVPDDVLASLRECSAEHQKIANHYNTGGYLMQHDVVEKHVAFYLAIDKAVAMLAAAPECKEKV